ncbi:hypothetical protein DFH07DRAFT_781359 [Mycena maculata]|uniref:Uncharacterized protein n=1 Tax=Mycena maculata TaxID=230809 RepID=A0AAD7HYN7_9AGAR|nr:hypothetical protein DFH07DRAFT_781359 [Mycena maculata]
MAWAFHISNPPVDFRSQYFEFRLHFRPESEGNPSTSFYFICAEVRPVLGSPFAQCMKPAKPYLEQIAVEEKAAGTKDFLGMFTCLCRSFDPLTMAWISTSEIYGRGIPSHRPSDKPWYWFPGYCIDLGLAFRVVGPSGTSSWKPGLMGKEKGKWVWKERSIQELALHGISLSRT